MPTPIPIADSPPGVFMPLSRLAEVARRIERVSADNRLCWAHGFRAPGYSAARARDALIGALSMLTDRRHNDLTDLMRVGRLVEEYGGVMRVQVDTCAICRRGEQLTIDAKRTPREPEIYRVCRDGNDCRAAQEAAGVAVAPPDLTGV